MKRALLRSALSFFICLIFNTAHGQFRSLHDSLTTPHSDWTGDTAWMDFSTEGLRTNAPSAGSLQWQRPSFAGLGAQWSLRIRMEFNPSSSNFCEFRFLEHHGNYYAIRLSGNSTDDLSFVRHSKYKDTLLASSPGLLNQKQIDFTLRIERDTAATFTVFVADTALFSLTDSTLLQSSSLSIYARYSASRVDKFLFSTLSASGYDFPDTLGPALGRIDVLNPHTLQVHWDEWCQLANPSHPHAYLFQSQEPVDTLQVINHYDEVWHLSSGRPLPRGTYELVLPAAVDAELNTKEHSSGSLWIDYAPPKSAWITAIHPFESYGGYFFTVQSERELGTVDLYVLEADGDARHHQIQIDSGCTVIATRDFQGWNTRQINELKLPKEGVIVLKKDHITLTVQPYSYSFAPDQRQGDFILTTTTPNATFAGWQTISLDKYLPMFLLPAAPPPQRPEQVFASSAGALFAAFKHPPFAYLELPGSTSRASALSESYDPMLPFLLPVVDSFPLALGDSLLPTTAPKSPESGSLLLNEIHFHPDTMEEFVELINTETHWVFLHEVQLTKGTGGTLDDAEVLYGDRAPYAGSQMLWPVIGPEQIRAFSAPFSLPNDSTEIQLLGAYGIVLDRAKYGAWTSGNAHRSSERISTSIAGIEPGNWGPHQSPWCCPSEASPNAQNSLRSGHINTVNAALSSELLSFDPGNFSPQGMLNVQSDIDARLEVVVYTLEGKLVTVLFEDLPLTSGEHMLSIAPNEWGISHVETGIYLVHVLLKKNNGVARKILPLSIYNP